MPMSPPELTRVEQRAGRWYKREDATVHRSGVNGAKWRQCQYLIRRAREAGHEGVVTGASVLSPQLAMTAVAAANEGLRCTIVVGGTTLESAAKAKSVALALRHGADLRTAAVGYNPALQQLVRRHVAETGDYELRYGVTTGPDATNDDVLAFHRVGAPQARNLPTDVRTLVVPFGTGNSTASLLLGLAERPEDPPERIVLAGIGPNRLEWLHERLAKMGDARGEPLRELPIFHHDLHGAGLVRYTDRVRWTSDGIRLHPTYEAKVARWLDGNPHVAPGWAERDGTACLWIIGGDLE